MKKLLKISILFLVILILFCACNQPDIDIPYGFTHECQVKLEQDLRKWVNEDLEGKTQLVKIYVYTAKDVSIIDHTSGLASPPGDLTEGEHENHLMLIEYYQTNIEKAKAEQDYETVDLLTKKLAQVLESYETRICQPIKERYQFALDWLNEHKIPWEFDIENIDYDNYKDVYISATVTKKNLIDLYLSPGGYFYKIDKEVQ